MATKSTNSILDRIAESEQSKKIHSLDIKEEVDFVLSAPKVKKDRDIAVIRERYGLDGEKPKTLEEIGKELGITRERVRQIEKNAVRKLSEFLATEIRGQEILTTIETKLLKDGGAVTTSRLYELLLDTDSASAKLKHMVCFLANLDKKIVSILETTDVKAGFYLDNLSKVNILDTIKVATGILDDEKKPLEEKAFLNKVEKTEISLSNEQVIAIISLSKKILRTETGHLGLSHWREINPKSIRDKTYYILKKYQKPLHFTDISKHIEDLDEKKKVTRQAVHNELIRDDRFVLIGRGIYALREWGYTSGVVEDVILEVLTTAGKPMHKDDIVLEVMKRRMVKETTILLNLQKDKFTRVARATYTITKLEG